MKSWAQPAPRLMFFGMILALITGSHSVRGDDRDLAKTIRQGNELLVKKDWDKAIEAFDIALRLDPKSFTALAGRASARAGKGELAKSIADYDAAIGLQPRSAFLYTSRGRVRGMKGELEKAISDFDTAIKVDPKHVEAFYNRGLARGHLKEWDKAPADFDEAIRLDPNSPIAFRDRGNVRANKGDWDKAIADLSEALRLDPKNLRALTSRASAFTDTRQWNRAIRDLDAALVIDPKDPLALAGRAWFWATHPDYEQRDGHKAVSNAKLACELSGWKIPGYLVILAAAYAEAGDFSEAVQWQKKALEDDSIRKKWGDGADKLLELYKSKTPHRLKSK